MKYVKPAFNVTKFDLNETVAACDRVVTGTETTKVYEEQTVYCTVGGQTEHVFNATSGCSTSAQKWFVKENNGTMYFFWYTGDTAGSNNRPSQAQQEFMESMGGGQGWHYSEVTSTDMVTDILGFSY